MFRRASRTARTAFPNTLAHAPPSERERTRDVVLVPSLVRSNVRAELSRCALRVRRTSSLAAIAREDPQLPCARGLQQGFVALSDPPLHDALAHAPAARRRPLVSTKANRVEAVPIATDDGGARAPWQRGSRRGSCRDPRPAAPAACGRTPARRRIRRRRSRSHGVPRRRGFRPSR